MAITAQEFAAKFQSKTEVYRFLASEVKAYLPNIETVTIFFLKEVASSERRYIKSDKAKHLSVPHFEGLTVDDFLEYAGQHGRVMDYFPPQKEIPKLPRQWIINVIYTLIGAPFSDWVAQRIQARNEKIKNEKNLTISMDPDIAAAFRNSHTVSGKLKMLLYYRLLLW